MSSVVQNDHGGQRLGFWLHDLVVVPQSAQFCLGSCKWGRNCWAIGQFCGTSKMISTKCSRWPPWSLYLLSNSSRPWTSTPVAFPRRCHLRRPRLNGGFWKSEIFGQFLKHKFPHGLFTSLTTCERRGLWFGGVAPSCSCEWANGWGGIYIVRELED